MPRKRGTIRLAAFTPRKRSTPLQAWAAGATDADAEAHHRRNSRVRTIEPDSAMLAELSERMARKIGLIRNANSAAAVAVAIEGLRLQAADLAHIEAVTAAGEQLRATFAVAVRSNVRRARHQRDWEG